jgi:hypothetical protein
MMLWTFSAALLALSLLRLVGGWTFVAFIDGFFSSVDIVRFIQSHSRQKEYLVSVVSTI